MKKSNDVGNPKAQSMRRASQQHTLFSNHESQDNLDTSTTECRIVAAAKRRDGGIRYWCLRHKADATAKYGKPASSCRAAHIPEIAEKDTFELDIDKYKGGIALWGAVPPVYDTTTQPIDRGIHVHARLTSGAMKEMDATFRAVRIVGGPLPNDGVLISELEAIYYMVASIFGHEMKYITCSYCGYPHLDRDWFSVRPHRRHLCAGCGKHFRDTETAIGNPICAARDAFGIKSHKPKQSKQKLDIRQSDFPGGIQVWGSNPAFIWTSNLREEEGIHVHAFDGTTNQPTLDETYAKVKVDGASLDPSMVRVLMAQMVLPSLRNRVLPVACPSCQHPHFSLEASAFTPAATHKCGECGREFSASGRLRKTIANPLLSILAQLAQNAPRKPQRHDLNLMPETI